MAGTDETFSLRKGALIVYLPTVLFTTAESAILPIVPSIVTDIGASLAVAGVVASMFMLGIVAGDIPAGWLVSRIGERFSMIWSSIVALGGVGLAAFARDPWTLGFGILLIGMATSVFALARHALLTTYVPMSHRARALSLLGGMFRFGAVIGPLLSAAVIALFGTPHAAFWLTGIGVLATILTVSFLPDPEKVYGTPTFVTESDGRVVTSGEDEAERERHGLFRTIVSNWPVLARLGTASAIVGALRSSRTVLFPLWAVSIGLVDAQIALIMGIATAIDFSLFYVSGYIMDRWGRLWSAVPAMVIMSLATITLAFTHDLPSAVTLFIVCAMVFALGNSLGSGIMLTLGSDLAPKNNPAPFLGAFRFTIDAGSGVAPLLVSGVTAVASISIAAGGLGVLGLVGVFMMWRFIPRYISVGPAGRTVRGKRP